MLFAAGCLQAIKPYRVPADSGREMTIEEVGRAFTVAGAEVETLDSTLGVVYAHWVHPYGNSYRRRFVGVLDQKGDLNIRLDMQSCEPFQPCVEYPKGWDLDQEALAEFASKVGQGLGRPAQVAP